VTRAARRRQEATMLFHKERDWKIVYRKRSGQVKADG